MKSLFSAILIILFVSQINCQSDKRKNKFRGRRPNVNCHLKQLQSCIEKVDRYSNQTEAYKLITTSRGIDEICSNSLEGLNCLKEHIDQCGTPIQREMFEFTIEQFQRSIDQFCKPGELRQEFLKHSPCIADNILSKDDYKKTCNQPYLASIDKVNKFEDFDDRLDLTCCSYNRWENCFLGMVSAKCQGSGREALTNFMEKTFASLINLVCKHSEFNFEASRCKSLYPADNIKFDATKANNPITKYLASYFRFLLTN
ncbi:uncharacterized protein LOC107371256 [Tetranychus urticae]|nr:uncharacterized protein LOC107371256 [Tetranychus urticae]